MKKLSFLFFICWQFSLIAQENINLHFDKNYYVLGETIWYSAYLIPDNPAAQKSEMLRVEMVDKEGIIQQENNLMLENGKAQGILSIPLDWEEGWYTFHAYTVWNPKPTIKNSATVNIPIYNDFKEHQENVVAIDNTIGGFENSISTTVKTHKENYDRRENIRVDIALPTAFNTATVSVAVVPKAVAIATNNLKITQANFSTTENQQPEAINTFYRQIESIENGKKPLGIGIHYASDNKIQWTVADEDGVFTTTNQLGRNQFTQAFGLFNNQNKTYTAEVPTQALQLTTALSTKYQSTEPLPFNEDIKKYLLQSQQRKKYQEIFNLKQATLTSDEKMETKKFQADITYDLVDYSSMTSIEEFLIEVVPFVKIKTKKGKRTTRMFDELKEFTDHNPVYLINEWLTYDQEAVLNIPISAIETITIYRTNNVLKNQFGVLGNNGVIGIKTTSKIAKEFASNLTNIRPVQGIEKASSFLTTTPSFKRLPDFRSIIYWESDLVVKDGKAQIVFPHSDDLGDFLIKVKGMTSDGQLIEGSGMYQVN